MNERAFFIDYSRCIGCESFVQACAECDTHRGVSMIHLEVIQRSESVRPHRKSACTVKIHLRASLSRRRHQENAGRSRAELAQAALYRMLQLRPRLSLWRAQISCRNRSNDEMRLLLRPHQYRQEADVRDGLSLRRTDVYHHGRDSTHASGHSNQLLEVRQ